MELNTLLLRRGSITMGEGKRQETVELVWEPMADFWDTQGVASIRFDDILHTPDESEVEKEVKSE